MRNVLHFIRNVTSGVKDRWSVHRVDMNIFSAMFSTEEAADELSHLCLFKPLLSCTAAFIVKSFFSTFAVNGNICLQRFRV